MYLANTHSPSHTHTYPHTKSKYQVLNREEKLHVLESFVANTKVKNWFLTNLNHLPQLIPHWLKTVLGGKSCVFGLVTFFLADYTPQKEWNE